MDNFFTYVAMSFIVLGYFMQAYRFYKHKNPELISIKVYILLSLGFVLLFVASLIDNNYSWTIKSIIPLIPCGFIVVQYFLLLRMKAKKILLVDDSHDFHEIFKLFLKKQNIDLEHAHSGEEAVGMIKKESYDLVFVDLYMDKGLNGIETINQIQNIKNKSRCILCSKDDKIKNTKFEHLSKPINYNELVKIVNN